MLLKHRPFKDHHTGCNGDGPLRTPPPPARASLARHHPHLLALLSCPRVLFLVISGNSCCSSQHRFWLLLFRVPENRPSPSRAVRLWDARRTNRSLSLALKELRRTTQFCLPALCSVRRLKGSRTRSRAGQQCCRTPPLAPPGTRSHMTDRS